MPRARTIFTILQGRRRRTLVEPAGEGRGVTPEIAGDPPDRPAGLKSRVDLVEDGTSLLGASPGEAPI